MGPLTGYKIIELAGLGPAPMAGMVLADMGAEVIRIERSALRAPSHKKDISNRGKKSLVLNLKDPLGKDVFFKLVETADALIEGYRPGVMEKLGFGPEACHKRNPKLVFGRMTGWGQEGPLAHTAGHDINYIALTGALHATGHKGERPVVPLNLYGDMGGGGMLLVNGILAALLEAQRSGKGQVVDAAMVDGAAQLMWMMHSFHANGRWDAEQRGVNLLDGGAHYYDTYETKDGKYIAIGAIEPQFYAELIRLAGLDSARFSLENQTDKSLWEENKKAFQKVFKTRTRDQWSSLLEGTDACFAPVLTMLEAPNHHHMQSRGTYMDLDGYLQPAPAPRFSRTRSEARHGEREPGADSESVLMKCGFSKQQIEDMKDQGVIQ